MSEKIVTRFAPSPTGFMHLGNAYSALYAWKAAHEFNGKFLLRIEDIDHTRCQEKYIRPILEDLKWLEIDWSPPLRQQSLHLEEYSSALAKLAALEVTYPCFCTRKQISEEITSSGSAPQGPDGPIYPGTCRKLTKDEKKEQIKNGKNFAVRLDIEAAERLIPKGLSWMDRHSGSQALITGLYGDVVIARKDIATSYHLAVSLDDAIQGVNLVCRGKDLFNLTHIHRLLQQLLNLPPPTYDHHRLLSDNKGYRLSKRNRSISLKSLKESGVTSLELRRRLGFT